MQNATEKHAEKHKIQKGEWVWGNLWQGAIHKTKRLAFSLAAYTRWLQSFALYIILGASLAAMLAIATPAAAADDWLISNTPSRHAPASHHAAPRNNYENDCLNAQHEFGADLAATFEAIKSDIDQLTREIENIDRDRDRLQSQMQEYQMRGYRSYADQNANEILLMEQNRSRLAQNLEALHFEQQRLAAYQHCWAK